MSITKRYYLSLVILVITTGVGVLFIGRSILSLSHSILFSALFLGICLIISVYKLRRHILSIIAMNEFAVRLKGGETGAALPVLSMEDEEFLNIVNVLDSLRQSLFGCRKEMEESGTSLAVTNQRMLAEIVERKRIENELVRHRYHLEEIVTERTSELEETNRRLAAEIESRRLAQERQAIILLDMERINQELNDYAYIISHDLKAPLRSIGTLTDWLVRGYTDKLDDEGREYITLLVKRVRRMHSLIESLLEYAMIGRFIDKMERVELRPLIDDILSRLDGVDRYDIKINYGFSEILFERKLIEMVFLHLIGNAVKYMDKERGEIIVGCEIRGELCEIVVTDNGPGIEERYFNKIFQIFQTLTPRDELEGNGIGLAIVRKIADVYGGSLDVSSRPGEGARFTLILPVERAK